MYYLVVWNKDLKKLIFRKRANHGIWKNMYDFPLIESSTKLSKKQLVEKIAELNTGINLKLKKLPEPVLHQLSHRKLIVYFISTSANSTIFKNQKEFKWFDSLSAKNLPLPRVIDNYLNQIKYFD
jgi:A/G-specific adenine glycosylase